MNIFLKKSIKGAAIGAALIASLSCTNSFAKDTYKIAWTIYAGWMPWDYAASSKIIDKWADKYNIKIEVVQVNDYVESINQYMAGDFSACVMTNMDALTIPAAGGVDSTAIIVGDYSSGNDAIILKDKKSITDIKGQSINLVELSVSHYLLVRALEKNGMSEADVSVVNTSDSDMVSAFVSEDVSAVATWNPLVAEILNYPNANKVFDSSSIPGEILDLTVAKTDVIKQHPEFAKALTGAWYEIMGIMSDKGLKTDHALTSMANAAGTDLDGYKAQLATTHMYYQPHEAVTYTLSPELLKSMEHIATFSFKHGLFGDNAESADFVGVETPSGVFGNPTNIKLRFDPSYMQMAQKNEL